MKTIRTVAPTLFAMAIVMTASLVFAQSCPMCKEAMTSAGKRLSDGFYYSIITLAFLPMGLVSGGAIFVIKSSYLKRHPETTLSTYGMVRASIRERFGKKSS
jgi:hypothetical protein